MPIISTKPTNMFFQGTIPPRTISADSIPGVVRAGITLADREELESFFDTFKIPKEIIKNKPIATMIDIIIPDNNKTIANEVVRIFRERERTIIGAASVIVDTQQKGPSGEPAVLLLLQVHYPEFLIVSDDEIIKPKNKNKKKLPVNFKVWGSLWKLN